MRLASLLLLLTACAPRVVTPYGTITKPTPEVVEYGNGAAGCWGEGDLAALALPACQAWAVEHGHRVLVSVLSTEEMEIVRQAYAALFPDSVYADLGELRGLATPDRSFYGYLVVMSEAAFEGGTWQDLLEHELRHIEGEAHAKGEDFE